MNGLKFFIFQAKSRSRETNLETVWVIEKEEDDDLD